MNSLTFEMCANRGGPTSQVECVAGQGNSNVEAFIGIAGPYDFEPKLHERDPELWNIAHPFAQVGRRPLVLIRLLHGERGSAVAPEISSQMNDLLAEANYDTELILFDGIHRIPVELTTEIIFELAGE